MVQVIPRLVCYCDQDWYASILPHCRVDGSDLTKPFLCPMDILFNPGHLDSSPLPYRMEPFLTDIRTPFNIRKSQEAVVMDSNADWVQFRRQHNNGAGGYVAMGVTAAGLREGLAGLERVHVLRFEGLRPAAFAGFGDAMQNTHFDKVFSDVVQDDAKWCCRCAVPLLLTATALIQTAATLCRLSFPAWRCNRLGLNTELKINSNGLSAVGSSQSTFHGSHGITTCQCL